MTLRSLMARYGRGILVNQDYHGELVTYLPKAGDERQVSAVVERKGRQRDQDGRIVGLMAEVWIPRDATTGATSIAAGDELEFAMVLGGEAARHRIDETINEDEGGFLVRCWQ